MWDNIINSGDSKKIVSPAHTKNSHDIHINMDVDVKTNLNRLRVDLIVGDDSVVPSFISYVTKNLSIKRQSWKTNCESA